MLLDVCGLLLPSVAGRGLCALVKTTERLVSLLRGREDVDLED